MQLESEVGVPDDSSLGDDGIRWSRAKLGIEWNRIESGQWILRERYVAVSSCCRVARLRSVTFVLICPTTVMW
jgi:hypothetical protein